MSTDLESVFDISSEFRTFLFQRWFQILDPDLELGNPIDGALLIEALELSLQRQHSKTDVREESNNDSLTSITNALTMKHNDSYTSTQLDIDEFQATIERTPTNVDNNVVVFDVFDETTEEYDDSSNSFINDSFGNLMSTNKKSTISYSRSISMPYGRPMSNEHYTLQVSLDY